MSSRSRLDLHQILVEVLGTAKVYFQPPATVMMDYPCIVYERQRSATNRSHANNILYLTKKCYSVTIIDKNPDSIIPDKIQSLPLSGFDRHFTLDNLNHYVFTIYY